MSGNAASFAAMSAELVRSRAGKILVFGLGVLGFGFVVWWFLIRKEVPPPPTGRTAYDPVTGEVIATGLLPIIQPPIAPPLGATAPVTSPATGAPVPDPCGTIKAYYDEAISRGFADQAQSYWQQAYNLGCPWAKAMVGATLAPVTRTPTPPTRGLL